MAERRSGTDGISRVVMLSGAAGSWGAARRTVERHGRKGLTLLFADTLIEDDDLYRFVLEAASNLTGRRVPPGLLARTVAIPSLEEERRRRRHLLALAAEASEWCPALEWIPCESRDLMKRPFMRRWLEEHRDPADTVAVTAYDWSEIPRFECAQRHWDPWQVEAPLCEAPYLSKEEVLDWMEAEGLRPPRLYGEGLRHHDCRGGQAGRLTLRRSRGRCLEPASERKRKRRPSRRLRNEEDRRG